MTGFAWPLLFLLLPLPYLIRRLFAVNSLQTEEALRIPFYKEVAALRCGRIGSAAASQKNRLIFLWIIWVLLILAVARPQWIGEPVATSEKVRNLMTVLDISGSMAETDFNSGGQPVNRITIVKKVFNDFLSKREGDRVGVVVFGTRSYLYVPLTPDIKAAKAMVDELDLGFAGPQTSMGDGMGLAFKSMSEVPANSKVVILLSDGSANAGALNVGQATKLAEQMGIKVYTIGVGAYEKEVRGMFGSRKVDPSADLDEATLKDIAERTGGKYFRAYDTDEMMKIYDEINRMEPVDTGGLFVKPVKELFYIPLACAVFMSALLFSLIALGVRRV